MQMVSWNVQQNEEFRVPAMKAAGQRHQHEIHQRYLQTAGLRCTLTALQNSGNSSSPESVRTAIRRSGTRCKSSTANVCRRRALSSRNALTSSHMTKGTEPRWRTPNRGGTQRCLGSDRGRARRAVVLCSCLGHAPRERRRTDGEECQPRREPQLVDRFPQSMP